jgi:hypothetical protein
MHLNPWVTREPANAKQAQKAILSRTRLMTRYQPNPLMAIPAGFVRSSTILASQSGTDRSTASRCPRSPSKGK